jgi:uncharacterized repeat protein (TIGR03843 family)
VSDGALAARLQVAPLEIVGRFADASNATLLVRLRDRDDRGLDEVREQLGRDPELDDLDPLDLAVYKPQRGERPLWDFPHGTLHRREVAAYVVDEALGWDLVPLTVLRTEGPFGPGSVQRFVPHDPQRHYFSVLEEGDAALVEQLLAMVLLDLVIDNADRKGGHVLVEAPAGEEGDERVRLVDHGVSFNTESKLRTVAWDLAGAPVPGARRADLDRLREGLVGDLGARLGTLLAAQEVARLRERVEATLALEVLPEPAGDHPYPWPLL